MIAPELISEISRHLHRRGVAVLQLRDDTGSVRIVIDGDARASAASVAAPAAAIQSNEEEDCIKAVDLGIFRTVHPTRGRLTPACGDAVVKGQALGLLQVGDAYSVVLAPKDGVVKKVLVDEGDLIDYGRPLFSLGAS